MFNQLLCFNIILYLEKVTSYHKFSKNLAPEVQVVLKISENCIEMLKKSLNFQKFQLK